MEKSYAVGPWTVLSQRQVYANNWIDVTEYNVLNPNGGKGIYGKVHFKNIATGVVALDDENNVYLVGQYRFTIQQYSWEIPEGGCALTEQPLLAAKRELLEETGLQAANWQQMLTMFLSNSVSDEDCYVYLATGLSQHKAMPEEIEQLAVKKLPFKEVVAMIDRGEIKDAVTVAAILKVQLMLQL